MSIFSKILILMAIILLLIDNKDYLIKKLKKMEYLTETETEYIINFDKIQNDFEKNKEILTASQVLEFERKKKNLTASQVKTLLPVRFDVLTPSQDNSTNADTTLCRMRLQEHPSNVHQHNNNNIAHNN